MNLDPIRNLAAETTGLFRQLLQSVTDISPMWPSQGAAGGSGLLMPALAGVAAAVTVALMLAIYFQTGYRSYRDMIRHGLTAALGLSLLAFAIVAAQYLLLLAMAFSIIRMVRGPRAQDRVLALDALYVNAMLLLLSIGIRTGSELYVEAGLIIALLGFAGTLAFSKFLLRGEVIE